MIIGLGTGRSGTTSLAKQLNIGHEKAYARANPPEKELRNKYRIFQSHGGDVSFTNINIAEDLYRLDDTIRFIHVTRPKKATVDSIEKYLEIWVDRQRPSPWATYFPQHDFKSRNGIETYYDWYYERVDELPFEVEKVRMADLDVHVNRLDEHQFFKKRK